MNEKPTKGRQFNTVIVDDLCKGEVSDEQKKATIEWFKTIEPMLSDVQVLPARSNKEISSSDSLLNCLLGD